MTTPQYISREELLERLRNELDSLSDTDSAWWAVHSVPPFPARHADAWHFIVAVAGDRVIFFADDEDEFGIARHSQAPDSITNYGLAGDLRDAISITRTNGA